MMDVKTTLFNLLNSICKDNVYLQGTLNPDEQYPPEFITYFTSSVDDNAHYSNNVTSFAWNFSVIYYADDPQKVATVPSEIYATLKQAGFIPQGKGSDIPSDVITHTGWAMDFLFIEYEGDKNNGS